MTIFGTLMRSILKVPNDKTCLEKNKKTAKPCWEGPMVRFIKFDPRKVQTGSVLRKCLKFNTVQYLYIVIWFGL